MNEIESLKKRIAILEEKLKAPISTRLIQSMPGIITTATLGVSGGVQKLDCNNETVVKNMINPIAGGDAVNLNFLQNIPFKENFSTNGTTNETIVAIANSGNPFEIEFIKTVSGGYFGIRNTGGSQLEVEFILTRSIAEQVSIDITPSANNNYLTVNPSSLVHLTSIGNADLLVALPLIGFVARNIRLEGTITVRNPTTNVRTEIEIDYFASKISDALIENVGSVKGTYMAYIT